MVTGVRPIHPLITRIVLLVVGTLRQAYIRFTGRTQVPVVTSEPFQPAIMPIQVTAYGVVLTLRQDQPRFLT